MNIKIQDNNVEANKYSMYPAAAYAVQGGIWICHFIIPVLYFYDVNKKKITFYRCIPEKYIAKEATASGICVINNKIYMAPCYGKYIIAYDIENGVFEEILHINENEIFCNIIQNGNILYFFPRRHEYIIKYNIKTGKIENEKVPFSTEEKFIVNATRTNEKVICIRYECSEIWVYDLVNHSWQSIELPESGWFNRIMINGENIYVHDYTYDKVKCINMSEGGFCAELTGDISCASPLGVYDGKIIINLEKSGEWLLCDEMLNVMERYHLQERFSPPKGWDYGMYVVKNNNGDVYYCDSCSIWTTDIDEGIIINRVTFTDKQKKDISRETIGKKLMYENAFNGIKEMCDVLSKK